MSVQDFDHPPKPRLTLRVGITGKRAIPTTERERIRDSLNDVFGALGYLLIKYHSDNSDFFSKEVPLLRIISGMAEGADQIAAEVAIKLHHGPSSLQVETRLAAILPFLQAEYEKDFKRDPFKPEDDAPDRPESESAPLVGRFQELLGDPAVESVLQIEDEALRTSGDRKVRDRAYGNLGEILLEHTDVLVAVSNDKYGGAGGTVDVLGAALQLKIPVIKISTLGPDVYSLRSAELDAADQTPVEAEQIDGAGLPPNLAEFIRCTLEPPSQNVPEDELRHHGHDAPRPVRERLNTFFREEPRSRFFDRVFKAFREAFSARPGPHEFLIMKFLSGIAALVSTFWSYRKDLRSAEDSARHMWPDTLNRFTADNGAKVQTVLAARHGWADAMAVSYADATRSAHILLAGLAASAVLMALMPFVLPDEPDEVALRNKMLFLSLELVVLAAAWALYRPVRNGRWHERFVEYRAVAELLRHERFIYALGAADRPGRAADRTWSEPDAWVGWYVRATLRELGFPTAIISATARRDVIKTFLESELEGPRGQIEYNRSLAEKYNTIDRRLEEIILGGFWVTVATAGAGILILAVYGIIIWCHGTSHEVKHQLHIIKPWLAVIAAFIPALIAALHGIRFQIDFKGTAMRVEATERELAKATEQIVNALAQPEPLPGRKQALSFVRDANEAMSHDLAGWSNIYRGKGPEI